MASSKHTFSTKLCGARSGLSKNDEQEDEEEVVTRLKSSPSHLSNKLERIDDYDNEEDNAGDEDDDEDEDEDDDENDDAEGDDKEHDAFRRQEQRRRRMTNSSILSSSSAGSSRLSQQYLIHNSVLNSHSSTLTSISPTTQLTVNQFSSNSNNKHKMSPTYINKDDHLYSYSTEINKKKLKQIIQSIPLPLAATCIITVIILILILSECKSLQAAQGAVQSLVMEPSPVIESGSKSIRETDEDLMQEKQRQQTNQQPKRRQVKLNNDENGHQSVGTSQKQGVRLIDQQLAFKREFINNLLQRHQMQFQPRQQRQQVSAGIHVEQLLPGEQQTAVVATPTTNQDSPANELGPGPGTFESLSAMLFGGNSASVPASGEQAKNTPTQVNGSDEEQVALADTYIDGEPSVLRSHELAEAKPASLRSSAIELDLNSDQQQQYHTQPLPKQQQHHQHQHYSQSQNQNHNQRQQLQQGNRYHQNQQAHKTNEEHMKQQQEQQQNNQQYLGNNHDRPFDVVQVQCNNTEEGFERFACPTSDVFGRYRCIEDRLFCDGYFDCPGGEDEERVSCMYYKLFVSHIDILTNTFLTWMKKQNRQQSAHHRLD